MPGPQGAPRADIIRLLAEGHSNRSIGRLLHTNPKRVSRIRRELDLPPASRHTTLTLEQAWQAQTEAVDGGHMRWTGYLRIAFRIRHGREPEGRVLPSCTYPGCIAPDHTTDQPMRDHLNQQYAAIFGRAA
jgi:hypothetical protein